MKLSCLQENLSKGVSVVSRLVSTRGTLEILSHILLKTEEGRLKLSATNLEVGINYKIGAKIDKDGAITVPARLFSELVTQLPHGKIDLSVTETTLKTKIDQFESNIKGLPDDEFPLIPRIKDKKLVTISAKDLKEAINMVSFAAAPDEARPVLAGIYMKAEKNKLTFVATDSYRLAERVIKLKEDVATKEAIIPARSLNELVRTLDDPAKEVDIYLDETQIMFETDEVEFTSRLIEGKFPPYKEIIPTSYETKGIIPSSDFSHIIKVTSLFSREAAGSVTIEMDPKGKIEAISAASQYGESNAACKAAIEGKEADMVFNSKYILDVLNVLSDGSIVFEVSGKLNPGVFKKEGKDDYVYVIMPLRA